MTYPTNPADALDADGAFVVGGDFNFGQGYTEGVIRNLFKAPSPTSGDPVSLLEGQLRKLPLDTLKGFQAVIQGTSGGDFNSVSSAVSAIIGALDDKPAFTPRGIFDGLFNDVFRWKGTASEVALTGSTQGYRNPAWVCRYPIGDVSYPEYLNSTFEVFGDTGPASTGTAHTHSRGDLYAEAAGWETFVGASRGSYITVNQTTVLDTIGMALWKDNSDPINNVFLEVFRETAEGGLVRLASIDVASSIETYLTLVEATVPDTIVEAGEKYMVRVRNSSTGTPPKLWCQAVVQSKAQDDIGFYTANATLSERSSYTPAECEAAKGNTAKAAWAMFVAKGRDGTPVTHHDDYNRLKIGGQWVQRNTAGSVGLLLGRAVYNSLASGSQNAIYIRRVSGDDQRVDGKLRGTFDSNGVRGGLLLCCSRDFSQVVFLGVDFSSAKLYTGPWNSLTERASWDVGGDGDWSAYYDLTDNDFTILKDGELVGDPWIDTGNVVQHGRDYRYGGFRVGRGGIWLSCSVDEWTFLDYSES